jgi:predicted ATPase
LSFKPKIPVALAGRSYLKQLLKAKEVRPVLFEKIGGVYYFDQRRTVKEHKNKRGIFLFEEVWEEPKKLDENIVEWLLEFFNKDFSWDEKQFGKSNWKQVQEIFDKICFPTKLEKMVSGPEFTDIVLKKENGETYGFNQASSGETQVIRFAVGLVVEAVWNSVVLLDELETHLHPEWQVKFLNFLENDGRNNQYLITTHSPFVASKFSDLQHLSLGELSE